MIIHNPIVSGSLRFPSDENGNLITLQVVNGTLETLTLNSSGVNQNVQPAVNYSGSFTGSFIGDGSGLTGLTSANNNTITLTAGAGLDGGGSITLNQSSDETITFTVSDGVISGSSQVDHDATTNFVAGEHFLQSAITTVGTVTTGNVQAILPSGTVSGSAQIDGSALGSNKTITISGTSVTLGGSITDETLFGGTDVLSGSLLPGTNVTINSSSDGYFISSSAAGGGANDATITLTAGTGLTGGGDFTTNQAGNETITFNFDSNSITGSFLRKLGDGVVSSSAQIALGSIESSGENLTMGSSGLALSHNTGADLIVVGGIGAANIHTSTDSQGSTFGQDVRVSGSLFVGKGTDSTSKTTGTLIVSGGLGVLTTINAGGDVVAFASSDERLKDNIKPIENPLDIISKISGNTFDWNSEKQDIYNGKDYGVIAQEIKEVMPELVDTRDSGYLAVKYDKIVPLLIESIKELKREIEELKSK